MFAPMLSSPWSNCPKILMIGAVAGDTDRIFSQMVNPGEKRIPVPRNSMNIAYFDLFRLKQFTWLINITPGLPPTLREYIFKTMKPTLIWWVISLKNEHYSLKHFTQKFKLSYDTIVSNCQTPNIPIIIILTNTHEVPNESKQEFLCLAAAQRNIFSVIDLSQELVKNDKFIIDHSQKIIKLSSMEVTEVLKHPDIKPKPHFLKNNVINFFEDNAGFKKITFVDEKETTYEKEEFLDAKQQIFCYHDVPRSL